MSKIEPNSGVEYGWPLGFSATTEDPGGWKTGMDSNLYRLGAFGFHLSVKDRDLTVPPVSPVDGDRYIPATGSTGAWSGMDGHVAIWDEESLLWVFGQPRVGWWAYIEDEEKIIVFKVAGWSVGVAV